MKTRNQEAVKSAKQSAAGTTPSSETTIVSFRIPVNLLWHIEKAVTAEAMATGHPKERAVTVSSLLLELVSDAMDARPPWSETELLSREYRGLRERIMNPMSDFVASVERMADPLMVNGVGSIHPEKDPLYAYWRNKLVRDKELIERLKHVRKACGFLLETKEQ